MAEEIDTDAPVTEEERERFARFCNSWFDPRTCSYAILLGNRLFDAPDAQSAQMWFQDLYSALGDQFANLEDALPGLFAKLRKRAGLPSY